MRRLADATVVLVALFLLVGVPVLLERTGPDGRLYLSWPGGYIWSNMLAAVWYTGISAFVVWYFRDHIGKRVAAWAAKHNPRAEIHDSVHRIVADIYKEVRGHEHPQAPQ